MVQFASKATRQAEAAIVDAQRQVFWLDRPDRPQPHDTIENDIETDLAVIGGGFSGLWAALLASDVEPDWDITLVEQSRIAEGATGRNGGFLAASLTHGFGNGISRWPDEIATLVELGQQNLEDIETFVRLHGISCDFRRAGELSVAVAEHQTAELLELAEAMGEYAQSVRYLDRDEVRARIHSPTYDAGLLDQNGVALVDPARLAWGMHAIASSRGIRTFERTSVVSFEDAGSHVVLSTGDHQIRARRVVVATNAFPSLVPAVRRRVVPVYDYVLMTEPLSESQWESVGWHEREGVSDAGNQFHYYRPTEDGRILWGGYDAVYHSGNGFGAEYENDEASYRRLATHFLQTFPQLEGIRFSHAWGGAIDTCTRFTTFWGTAAGGKLAYLAGFTGLGVGASRFAAQVALDLLDGRATQRTRLTMVSTLPRPFPPEPMRSIGIRWTTASLRRADANGGKRNIWLRSLDRLGMGFDS